MKKFYFLTFTYIFLSLFTKAQSTYYKMLKEDTTTWQHFGWMPGVAPEFSSSPSTPVVNFNCYAAIDTISIGSNLYRKLYWLGNQISWSNMAFAGYMREDTIAKRIYYRETTSTSDLLLYDFSLNVADSVYLTFPNYNGLSGYYRVDSIVVKNEHSGPRRHFYYRKHMNNPSPTQFYFDNVEGIGSTFHIAYIFTPYHPFNFPIQFSNGCKHYWGVGLACKHDDQTKKYKHCSTYNYTSGWYLNQTDSCSYYFVSSGSRNNERDEFIKIGPNPSDEKFTVEIKKDIKDVLISISDLGGKIMSTIKRKPGSHHTYEILTKDLSPGVYIVKVKLDETVVTKPIVVQH